jgi:predicted MarR family transcription regulator
MSFSMWKTRENAADSHAIIFGVKLMQDLDRYMTHNKDAAMVTRAELATIRAIEAFSRWSFFLHRSVSPSALAAQDVWLLHAIRMRGGAQNLSELLLFFNRNDVSALQYSLRKIEQAGLIERIAGHSRREAGYRLTDAGMAATSDYAEARDEMLITLVGEVAGLDSALENAATALERLASLYDQSVHTLLNRRILGD